MTPNQDRVEAFRRTLLIIWAFLFLSVGGFFLLTKLAPSQSKADDAVLPLVLVAAAFSMVVLSFVLKKSFLAKSVAQQDLRLVSQAYIVALALCESAGLFGLLIHFINGSVYYYAAFGLAWLGMLLHFPSRQHIQDATFEKL
jgi:hypothetical protein